MRKLGLLVVSLFLWCGWAGATCPSNITSTISPTSCWNLNAGSGTTIADSSGSNTGTLGGTGFTWESDNSLFCSNAGGSGCNITTTATYSQPQPVTLVFKFAGTQGPILQLGSSSSATATSQFYLAYLDRLGRLTFGVNNYGNESVLQSSLSYADGNQHIAVVSLSQSTPNVPGGMRMTIDGVTVASRNVQLANYISGAQWLIGGANATIWPNGPGSNYFNGTIYYVAWLNGTAVTDAQAQAISGTSVSPISGVPLSTITATIGSLSDVYGFAPPPGTSVYFTISGIQRPNTGDYIIAPTPNTKACMINSSGNLVGPTGVYANCQLPQGAHVTMQIGATGQPLSLIIPFQSSVDLATLILAQTDPTSIINQIAVAGPLLVGTTVTNPATGQVGVATITAPNCSKVTVSSGTYTLDTSTATCQIATLSASSTITVANLVDSQIDTVYTVQDGTGGWAPTFAAPGGDSLKWTNGGGSSQPTMPTNAANSIIAWQFVLNGSTIYGSATNINSSVTQTTTFTTGSGTFSTAPGVPFYKVIVVGGSAGGGSGAAGTGGGGGGSGAVTTCEFLGSGASYAYSVGAAGTAGVGGAGGAGGNSTVDTSCAANGGSGGAGSGSGGTGGAAGSAASASVLSVHSVLVTSVGGNAGSNQSGGTGGAGGAGFNSSTGGAGGAGAGANGAAGVNGTIIFVPEI